MRADAPSDIADVNNGVLSLRYSGGDDTGAHEYWVKPEVVTNDLTLQKLGENGYFDPEYYTSGELQGLVDQLQSLRTDHSGEDLIVVSTGARVELFLASAVSSIVATGTNEADTYRLEGLNGRVDSITINAGGGVDLIEVQGDASASNAFFGTLFLDGGSGDDYLRVDPSVLGVAATSSSYILRGGDGGDRIKLLKDKDDDAAAASAVSYSYSGVNIEGGAGDDVLFGHTGSENFLGGDGNDVIYAFAGDDTIDAGNQDDYVTAGPGNDTITAGAGNDRVLAGVGQDVVHGGAGNDRLLGQDDADTLYGDAGDDVLIGGLGDDTLYGGDDSDAFNWQLGDGADIVSGDAGDDQLSMIAYMIDEDAFYSDPDNYVIDDAAVDTLQITATSTDDVSGFKTASLTWQHASDPLFTTSIGAVETVKLDAGRGADDVQIGDLQTTAVDSVRVSGGETRGLVDDVLISRDAEGRPIAQDVTIVGAVGDQFRLKFGPYGKATEVIELSCRRSGSARSAVDSAGHPSRIAQIAGQHDAKCHVRTGFGHTRFRLGRLHVHLQSHGRWSDFRWPPVGRRQSDCGCQLVPRIYARRQRGPIVPVEARAEWNAHRGHLVCRRRLGCRQLDADSHGHTRCAQYDAQHRLLASRVRFFSRRLPSCGAEHVRSTVGAGHGRSARGRDHDGSLYSGIDTGRRRGSDLPVAIRIGRNGDGQHFAQWRYQRRGYGCHGDRRADGAAKPGRICFRCGKLRQHGRSLPGKRIRASGRSAADGPCRRDAGNGQFLHKPALNAYRNGGQPIPLAIWHGWPQQRRLGACSCGRRIARYRGNGGRHPSGAAALSGNSAVSVSYDSSVSQYLVKGLAASDASLQIDLSGQQSDVVGSTIVTRNVGLSGSPGQQFRLQFGPAGNSTGVLARQQWLGWRRYERNRDRSANGTT